MAKINFTSNGFPFVKFKRARPEAILPKRATEGSGAFDIFAPGDGSLLPGERLLLSSGIIHEIEDGLSIMAYIETMEGRLEVSIPFKLQGLLFDRSSLAKRDIYVSFGLVDHDFRGEIILNIINRSTSSFSWVRGERLCQIGYVPMYAGSITEAKELSETARGTGGFGSTGK